MEIKKNITFLSVAVTSAALVLTVFLVHLLKVGSFKNNEPTPIYYVDNISNAHQKIIDLFNEKYVQKIKVIPVNIPFSKFTTNERKEILARALRSGGERIDVFAVDLIWGARFAKWSYPLEFYFDDQSLNEVKQNVLESCYFNGKMIAMPLHLDIGLLYYRKDLIQALPDGKNIEQKILNSITWTDFIGLRKLFNTDSYPYYIFAGDKFEGLVCSFHELLNNKTADAIFNNKLVDLNNSDTRYALQTLVDFIHKYQMTPVTVSGFTEHQSYIFAMENDAVFFRGWPGFHKQYRDIVTDTLLLDKVGIAPLPHFEGNSTSAVYGGWNLMVSKFSDNKKEAIAFLKFTLEKESQQIMYEEGGYIPVNNEVFYDQSFMQRHPRLKYYNNLLKWGKHRPFRADYTKISDIISYYINQAIKKRISVEMALEKASLRINSESAFIK